MQKEFNEWNNLKIQINNRIINKNKLPKEREVWMASLGKNIGFEQNGNGNNFSRPVLIIKKFNNQMFLIAPLSTKQKKLDFYLNFRDIHNKEVSIILAQIKLLSIKRMNRKIYDLQSDIFIEVKNKIKSWF